jgi:ABC-type Fe3+/spermidine/putrescine transport system ATPase subunit
MSDFLQIDHLYKSYPEFPGLLAGVTLSAQSGDTVAILGNSGSGKTTLLRILAGLESSDRGHIFVSGDDITETVPEKRNIGFMFQGFALFPHLSVSGNIAFGLRMRHQKKTEIKQRVTELLRFVDLEGFGDRPIAALSTGQQQRVAYARALAPDPRILLLDEPMSALDQDLKGQLLAGLRQLIEQTGKTTLYITHDPGEAAEIASHRYRLSEGKLVSIK